MTYKEKRNHKFRLLFMLDFKMDNIDSVISNYFENVPYDEDEENSYIEGDLKSHKNVSKVVIKDDVKIENESDKAVSITLSEEDDIQDIKNKIKDIISKSDTIDGIIKENLETWDINRVGKAELAIIRLAVYEMYYDETVDLPVAINEAVELAKTYGDDKAPKFVNGVLSTVYKNHK